MKGGNKYTKNTNITKTSSKVRSLKDYKSLQEDKLPGFVKRVLIKIVAKVLFSLLGIKTGNKKLSALNQDSTTSYFDIVFEPNGNMKKLSTYYEDGKNKTLCSFEYLVVSSLYKYDSNGNMKKITINDRGKTIADIKLP